METLSRRGSLWAATHTVPRLLALAALLLALTVPGTVNRPAVAQQQGGLRVFVESPPVPQGGAATSQVVLMAPAEGSVTEVSFELEFDPAQVQATAFDFDSSWDGPAAAASPSGELQVMAASPQGCAASSACRIGTVTWQGISGGDSEVRISEVVAVVAGVRHLAPASAFRLRVGEVPAASSAAEPQAGESLSIRAGLAMMMLLVLAGGAIAIPLGFAVVRVARRRRARRLASSVPEPALAEYLALAAAGYLDAYELAGSAHQAPDGFYEAIAREVTPPSRSAVASED